MAAVCSEYGLWASCGSDFHHPEMHWAELGKFAPLPQQLTPVWDKF
jgi:hypothetical protein